MLVRYEIKNISKNNEYTLFDGKNTQTLMLELFDIERPCVGDYISLDNSHFIKKLNTYTQPYSFENAPEVNENDMEKDPKEFCLVESPSKIFFLRRIYG